MSGQAICFFCQKRPVELLCDGRLPGGKTCDAGMCAQCATNDSTAFLRLTKKDPVTKSRCVLFRMDRCPSCVRAGRTTELLRDEALNIFEQKPPQQGRLF